MSHVDEGTLHAYLDGELASGERATLEAHVAQCATCRAALADERALRDRASAVLSLARPSERPAPSLEQLRRASPAKRSPWHLRTSSRAENRPAASGAYEAARCSSRRRTEPHQRQDHATGGCRGSCAGC
ncbi:MAG: hypothetical protein AUG85_07270 [Gemmatimonadetes bacterium 13_1_20CM_4_66_11]|nr:MAG: hypothetical protein AUG85_07270 [Gemmatimonadetes bacterium 13_1_20CM_4_66_11]